MRITKESKTVHFTNNEAINLWSLEKLTVSMCIEGIWRPFELRTDDRTRLTKSYLSISLETLADLNRERWVKRKMRCGNTTSEWSFIIDDVNAQMGFYT